MKFSVSLHEGQLKVLSQAAIDLGYMQQGDDFTATIIKELLNKAYPMPAKKSGGRPRKAKVDNQE